MTQPRLSIPRLIAVFFVVLLFLGAPVTTIAQQDTTPPVLLELSYTPSAIDTTNSSQDVTVTARITDDLSGFSDGCIFFSSPSQTLNRNGCFGSHNRISGDALDGTYQTTITFQQFIEAGTWHISSSYANDLIGNQRTYNEQDLINLGFPTTLDVTSAQDTTPPVLQSLSYSPASIDVSNGAVAVTVTARITDDLSGFSDGCIFFSNPSQTLNRNGCFGSHNRISGDALDGTYQTTITFQQFIEAGTWHISSSYANDLIGNQRTYNEQDLINLGFPTTLDVTSNPEDITPPVLVSLSFNPKAINTSSSDQNVTVTARITDDLSGFSDGCIFFSSPSQTLNRNGCFGSHNRISGDALDGTYQTTITFQQFIEAGTWHISSSYANDLIGNQRTYNEQDLINLGFPTTLLNTTDQFPVANAGPDQLVEIGLMATLDGSASFDPEAAGPLTYEWRNSNGNVLGTTASINVAATFATKTYTLTVTDVVGLIGSDTVDVTGQDTTPPVVTVLKPNGGEKLFVNSPYVIQWNASDLGVISFFDVFYSINGPNGTFNPITDCSRVSGLLRSCTWNAPGSTTTLGRIQVTATDASGNSGSDNSNANFSIVSGAGTITVTAPNTAVDWGIGSTQKITWTHNMGLNSYVRIEVSRDGRETWEEIAASVKNTAGSSGTYNWVVTGPVSAAARIRVSGVNVLVSDISNVYFTISEPYIGVASPAVTSTNFGYGTQRTQKWTTNLGPLDRVDVFLSTDGGATCTTSLGSNRVATSKTLTYIVPTLGSSTTAARICIRWTTNATVQGLSPVNFRVEPAYIQVTYPNLAGDAWTVSSSRTITWANNLGTSENVMIELSLDDGANYTPILASTPSDGTQAIVVPGPPTQTAKIRITWLDDNTVKDASSESFPIN